jgi:Lrp/AsnC family transcriptional regulator, regulator for asnA, asnC and gidA
MLRMRLGSRNRRRPAGRDHAGARREGPAKPIKLLPADQEIIGHLSKDARATAASIAAELRMPESTVRHRMNRLVQEGVIEFAVLTNPLQLGYHIWALLHIQVEMPRVRNVAERLAAAPEVYFVGVTTGSYDIFAGAVFRSNDELLDFIVNRLAKVPGVVRTTTSNVLQVVKRVMSIGVPDGAAAGRQPPRARRRGASAGKRDART